MEHLHTAAKNKKHRKVEISFSETSTNSSDHYGDNQSSRARPTVEQSQGDDSSESVSKRFCQNEQGDGETGCETKTVKYPGTSLKINHWSQVAIMTMLV